MSTTTLKILPAPAKAVNSPPPRRAIVIKLFYFFSAALVVAVVGLNYYHPAAVVGLEILTDKLQFQPDSAKIILEAVPVSLLGLRGWEAFSIQVEEAFWPVGCQPAAPPPAAEQMIGPTELLFTPNPGPDAQFFFLGAKLQITDLRVVGAGEIGLWPRSSQAQNQFNLEIRGGQQQLQIQMLSHILHIQTQEYQIKARETGQNLALLQGCLEFRPRADDREARISGSGPRALISYDVLGLDPVNENLLALPMGVERLSFYEAEKGTNGDAAGVVEAECVAFNAGDKTKPEWQGQLVRMQKDDLRHFELLKVRAAHPGRLLVALRGKTGKFRAGLGKTLENQLPSALSHLEAQLGLLTVVLIQMIILFFTLKERIKGWILLNVMSN